MVIKKLVGYGPNSKTFFGKHENDLTTILNVQASLMDAVHSTLLIINPYQVEGILQGEDIATPLSDSAKSDFSQKVYFLLTRGHRVWIRAIWGHKDYNARHTVTGRVYFLNPEDPVRSELKARWDDEPDVEYGMLSWEFGLIPHRHENDFSNF